MATLGGVVAVTGAAGFLGGHFVEALASQGERALPLVRTRAAGSPAGAETPVELERALADPRVLRGVEVVVHSAAIRHRHGFGPEQYRVSNVDLVERVMRAAHAAGARRFVLVSSVGVYGFPNDLPVTERHPYAPRTLYAATKVDSERLARRCADELRMDLVIVRPTIVYGPGDRNGMLDKMVRMTRSGRYAIVGTGRNALHHTHVDDIMQGLWLAVSRSEASGDDFILAGPETTTLEALSKLVAEHVGRRLFPLRVPLALGRAAASAVELAQAHRIAFVSTEPPINHEKLDIMTLPISFDSTKAQRLLGFRPAVGYAEGVRRTLASEASGRPDARRSIAGRA